MQYLQVIRALGILLCSEALLMIPSLVVALLYKDGDVMAFVYSMALLLACGLPPALLIRSGKRQFQPKDGMAVVGLGWILLALFGSFPFYFSGAIPSFVDSLFESVSGFTTAGATALLDVQSAPHGILFWRAFTQWVGGMGVLVLTIAILPQLGSRNLEILRAESPGPTPTKFLPRLRESTKVLYAIYIGMSIAMVPLLLLTGIPLFDCLTITFATAGTGGYSVLNDSIGGYQSVWVEAIIGTFMFLFGINFAVYFYFLTREFKKAVKNQELILYVLIAVGSIVLITINIAPQYSGIFESLRYAAFQVASFISTTGYETTNVNTWPMLSQSILLFLMILGGCAGSTSGGLKVSRLLLLAKAVQQELYRLLHPRIVRPIYMDGNVVEPETMRQVLVFFFAYIGILILGTMVVSLENYDFLTTFSSVLSATGNIGAKLGFVGLIANYTQFSPLSKMALSVCMMLGRLEIMPILLLCVPSLWKQK